MLISPRKSSLSSATTVLAQAVDRTSTKEPTTPPDVILKCSTLTRIIKSLWNKLTEIILVQSLIFVGFDIYALFWLYLEL
jgi:hypothetical protein